MQRNHDFNCKDGPLSLGGTGTNTLNNLITLGLHTTGNYVATISDFEVIVYTVNNFWL